MTEYRTNLRRETAAQKVQAAFRGYQVRKVFLAVRVRFEALVKSIDQNKMTVQWSYSGPCYPSVSEDPKLVRLRELDAEESRLLAELQATRKAIQARKDALLSSVT